MPTVPPANQEPERIARRDLTQEGTTVIDRSATSTDAAARIGSDEEGSALERRREALQARTSDATATVAEVVALDAQLATNASTLRDREAALKDALSRVAVLKKKVKASVKEQDTLRGARKDARRRAAAATQRANTAEVKYDRAVLADMVRREKDDDLAAHPDQNAPERNAAYAPRKSATTTRPRS